MTWDSVVLEEYQGSSSLVPMIGRLLDNQKQEWQQYRQGVDTLATVQAKVLLCGGSSVTAQANPGRKRSTHAKTDAKSISERRCFLCPENIPPEEKGIAFGDLVILPNPFPVLPWHCTIPAREHVSQRIEGRLTSLLELAGKVGPELCVFYNGPRCGASAPDHFHFQACSAENIPILKEPSPKSGTSQIVGQESFGRHYLLLTGSDSPELSETLERVLEGYREFDGTAEEPLMNLLVHSTRDVLRVFIFPRSAHRPSCFHAEGSGHLAVSPAALEMAGVLVCSEPEHFNRIEAADAYQIYQEVSLDTGRFSQLLERIR